MTPLEDPVAMGHDMTVCRADPVSGIASQGAGAGQNGGCVGRNQVAWDVARLPRWAFP